MEKNIKHRKIHYLRNKSKHEMDMDEAILPPQRSSAIDKSCQTDHGCCNADTTVEPGDPPLLQKPAQTSTSGILQIIECFRSGTKQLRLMLLKEVDTIFECKTCRSLFRGLPNLITHKEFYCISKHYANEDPPKDNKQSEPVKDLNEAGNSQTNQPEFVVQLEPIQSNQNAVFQTIKPVSELNLDVAITSVSSDTQKQCEASTPQPALNTVAETIASTSVERIKKEPTSVSPSAAPSDVSNLADLSNKMAANSNPFLCLLCKKDFNCRRSVRRHIKRVHKKKIEDIKKFIRIHRKTPRSSTKGHVGKIHMGGKSCHLCHKSFASKANTRRHIDEVHKGLRRDYGAQENTKPPNVTPEPIHTKKYSLSRKQEPPVKSEISVSSFACSCCKRVYTSQYLLKKHIKLFHKIASPFKSEKRQNLLSTPVSKIKIEETTPVEKTPISVQSSPKSESTKGSNHVQEKKTSTTLKGKSKSDGESPKASSSPSENKKGKKPKMSAGFDFKQLYCKLCKRQFTSKQNLVKHIELHTDGNCIFVKFYRCPLCTYETRRKRDVIRHITVVHKKTQRALIKITGGLENRAIKKPIESILDKVLKKDDQKDKSKKTSSKPDGTSSSTTKKSEVSNVSTEVKLTKHLSLHKCNVCTKSFAKKKDLDQHKKNHKTKSKNASVDLKIKARKTRLKVS